MIIINNQGGTRLRVSTALVRSRLTHSEPNASETWRNPFFAFLLKIESKLLSDVYLSLSLSLY